MQSNYHNFSKDDLVLNNKYIIKDLISSGSTAEVYKCIDIETGLPKAAKIFQKISIIGFKTEAEIMEKISEINSSSLMKCYESGIKFLTQQEKSILEDMHKNGFCHRDIKSENIVLCGDNYEIKLCDFGYSTKFIDNNNQKKKLDEPKGTPYYAAPEMHEGKEYEGDKVDIFSLGALLFVLMTKKFGFLKATIDNISMDYKKILYKLIKTKQYQKYWKILEKKCQINSLSENFKNLFLKMVAYKPEERPTIDEIKNDEWLKDMINATPEQLNFLRNKMISEIEAANN